MIIEHIKVTPLRLMLKTPYVWSQGVENAFTVNLIAMHGKDGTIGYGENTTAPDALAQKQLIDSLADHFIGHSVFDFEHCRASAYRARFLAFGANMPRYANQVFCGLEMAALDLQGKYLGRPVWDLLGGAHRKEVGYFYFLQGETVEALAEDAADAARKGHPIIYVKVGVEPRRDIEVVRRVRQAIGETRLRLDANEAWDGATTMRMIGALEPYDVEYIEQPTPSSSISALKQVRDRSPIAIGADQSVFTLQDVYQACSTDSADMIAVGPREIGGLRNMMKAAAITEASEVRLCIHSSMSTGITTCAEHHLGRAIPKLDDGNQIMWQLLEWDIVARPSLTPNAGKLSMPPEPGLGFTLNEDAVAEASACFKKQMNSD